MGRVNHGPSAVFSGYSDKELERLSASSLYESGLSPWAAWESENSSFGKTFRKWACYPSVLPLCISSDHGVHWESRCWPNEIDNKYKTFFTWHKKKCELMRSEHGKKSYHVPHPWVFYRRKYFPNIPENRSGTLVFYAHSNSTTTPVYENLDDYINDLKSLPEKYHPVAFCLSFHDIRKGLHKELRKYGIPLVTAGTTASQKFVDRFYSLVYKFKFASSPNVGSHTYYVMEAGVPFFLFGACPEYHIRGSAAVKDGKQDLKDYGDEEDIFKLAEFKELLSSSRDEVTPEQYALVSEYLGMNAKTTRLRAALIIWRELILHADDVAIAYVKLVFRAASKVKSSIYSRTR
ncbi:MAG: hypothetical protein PHF20_00185 [Halothiobacillaceae bacterium]|nr:hypothetical protein [Halothiobacillaceae bacterium]